MEIFQNRKISERMWKDLYGKVCVVSAIQTFLEVGKW